MSTKIDPIVVKYCKTKDDSLKSEIIKNYKPLIEYIARKLAFNRNDIDDLYQVGSIAVIKCLDRFDLSKNVDFSTFATPNIIGEIKHYFRDKSKVVKIPRKVQELYSKIKSYIAVEQQNGNTPTVFELSRHLEVSEEKILEAMEVGQNHRILSLDSPTSNASDGGSNMPTLFDKIGTSNKEDFVLDKETLKESLKLLTPRERRVVYLRFYGGFSQSEIAVRMDLSQMHISRLLSRAVSRLRKELYKQ